MRRSSAEAEKPPSSRGQHSASFRAHAPYRQSHRRWEGCLGSRSRTTKRPRTAEMPPGRAADATARPQDNTEQSPSARARRPAPATSPAPRATLGTDSAPGLGMPLMRPHALARRLIARQGPVNHAGIVDRTGGYTLRLVIMANAFGTFRRFNDKVPLLLRYSNVRT